MTSAININMYSAIAFAASQDKGFHKKEESNEHWLGLIHEEISEWLSAERKQRYFCQSKYDAALSAFDKTQGPCAHMIHIVETCIKGTAQEELADIAIRTFDLLGCRGIKVNSIPPALINQAAADMHGKTVAEIAYHLHRIVSGTAQPLKQLLVELLAHVYALSRRYDRHLLFFIDYKIDYNKHRPYMHGKTC